VGYPHDVVSLSIYIYMCVCVCVCVCVRAEGVYTDHDRSTGRDCDAGRWSDGSNWVSRLRVLVLSTKI
jgi:hypothetical protein